MKKLENTNEVKWIYNSLNRNYNKGVRISRIMPPQFESYVKIQQPMYRGHTIKNDSLLYRDSDPDEKIDFELGEKFTYKEIAEKYGLKYTKEINTDTLVRHFGGSLPRYLLTSDEGNLDIEIVKCLIEVLKPYTTGKCYFFYEFNSAPRKKFLSELLFHGDLSEVTDLIADESIKVSPTYWWTENRSWCIHTDIDSDFTLLGGNKELIDYVLKLKGLEMFEVDPDTRIDPKADEESNPG